MNFHTIQISFATVAAALVFSGCGTSIPSTFQSPEAASCTSNCAAAVSVANGVGKAESNDFYLKFTKTSSSSAPGSTPEVTPEQYEGSVELSGSILVNQASKSRCGLSIGTYQFQKSSASISKLWLTTALPATAVGPTRVKIQIAPQMSLSRSDSVTGPDGSSYTYRLSGRIVVEGSEGQSCTLTVN